MPFIRTTTNTPIPPEKREMIKARLGQDAAIIGKSEAWLMLEFCEGSALYFKGTQEPAAMVQVSLYGSAGGDAYDRMTAAITGLLGDALGIPAGRVFVSYHETTTWGWNGGNF